MSTQQTQPQQSHPPQDAKQKPKSLDEAVQEANPKFPFTLYNQKPPGDAKVAKDQDEYDKLTKKGYGLDALPPQDPDALTQDEVKTLQSLLAKAAKALEKLGKLSQQEEAKQPSKGQPEAPAGKK